MLHLNKSRKNRSPGVNMKPTMLGSRSNSKLKKQSKLRVGTHNVI